MAYIYTLEMKLAKSSDSIELKNDKSLIEESFHEYNNVCSKSTNKKTIELLNVENNSILLRLSSETKLNAVGKALRYLSKMLLERIPALNNNLTSSGQLFRVNTIGFPTTDPSKSYIPLQISKIDDSELIKSLIDYVCKKRDSNTSQYIKKVKAVEKMKQLAIESGLIIIERKDLS